MLLRVMIAKVKSLLIWAVEGPGSVQGRGAVAIAFLLMMLPVAANVIGRRLFHYNATSLTYERMAILIALCWVTAALWLTACLTLAILRLAQALLDFVPDRWTDKFYRRK